VLCFWSFPDKYEILRRDKRGEAFGTRIGTQSDRSNCCFLAAFAFSQAACPVVRFPMIVAESDGQSKWDSSEPSFHLMAKNREETHEGY
jgi:hypothetical protein